MVSVNNEIVIFCGRKTRSDLAESIEKSLDTMENHYQSTIFMLIKQTRSDLLMTNPLSTSVSG